MTFSCISIFKRNNGIWYILYTQDGRRRWKSTRTTVKSEALAQLVELKDPAKEKPKTQLFSEFTKEFLAYAETTYARATRDIYRVCLRHLQRIVHE
ncbi:hypothetical protein D4R75_11570 [bacterium]|nr:MAG: hypothetical protein D4R75_11570 [bacterium]